MDTAGYVEVSLASLARNYATMQRAAAGAAVGAVVKADAYGLGAAQVTNRLLALGCRHFFVATLEEGVALRRAIAVDRHRAGDDSSAAGGKYAIGESSAIGARTASGEETAVIYVFEGLRKGNAGVFVEHRLRPVLNTAEQLGEWREVGQPCAVQVDTGMRRLGVTTQEFAALLADRAALQRLGLRHVLTHLACADEPEHAYNEHQLQAFAAIRARAGDLETSIANSAGAFLGPEYRADVVRAGIGLFGGNPFASAANPMAAVATLYARVLQLREYDEPAYIGYGATYLAPAGSRIATVGVGYADGYPRALGNSGQAAFGGARLPVVGRVSMDLTCLDVSALEPGAMRVGDYVEMFGANVSVDEVAARSATISYEILTGLNARLPRIYVE